MSDVFESAVPAGGASGARRLGWWVLWLLLAAISLHFLFKVLGQYGQLDPEHYTMYWSRRGWLWLHIGGGVLGIVLGPVQFLSRWPRARPRLHRWSGRFYFGGMLLACAAAVGLIATSPAPLAITLAFAATALAWLVTALVAMLGIRRGDVARHRRWMTRAYLVTLAPVSFRLLLPAWIALGNAPSPDVIAVLLWVSWVLPVSLHVVWVNWPRRSPVMAAG
jgi:uncharacterized membrane protein